ncbi:stage V sporulation protein AB [Candidatus Contubernalis alkaliaceticus]|uniref:stage V sporulation protein AB n=1 Tax=Candidatus Contubernalis alkaliaceticus TaxID=338645 RepID=UPI001F4C4248|nr:stage V sporulation protein AB [Candidatus Contubernalis alkalaceticus]UNC92518.1 stage V sporulation protein AB [Candidatus Contubernalis alkalaceticus]
MDRIILMMIIGLAEGIVVGTALVAFLTILDIVPRLAQLTGTGDRCLFFEYSITLGAVLGTLATFLEWNIVTPIFLVVIVGLLMGVFVGMLAAALTEVLNVLPILSKRLGLQGELSRLVTAMVFGKVMGSLFYWLVPGLW